MTVKYFSNAKLPSVLSYFQQNHGTGKPVHSLAYAVRLATPYKTSENKYTNADIKARRRQCKRRKLSHTLRTPCIETPTHRIISGVTPGTAQLPDDIPKSLDREPHLRNIARNVAYEIEVSG